MALAAGCAAPMGPLPEVTARQASQRACARADWFASDRAALRVEAASPPQPAASGVRSVTGFSSWAVEVADTIGALALLQRMPDLEAGAASDRDAELALLRVRQALTERILLAMLEVSGVLAEVECESERGNQLRDRLQRAEEARARRLGLASILIGATTAILSGGLALTHPELIAGSVVGTLGGTAEAAAGLSLQLGSRTGELYTDRNLVREVWEGPERSTLLPRLVWRFLMRPARGDADGRTVRQKLLDEWRADGRLGAPGS